MSVPDAPKTFAFWSMPDARSCQAHLRRGDPRLRAHRVIEPCQMEIDRKAGRVSVNARDFDWPVQSRNHLGVDSDGAVETDGSRYRADVKIEEASSNVAANIITAGPTGRDHLKSMATPLLSVGLSSTSVCASRPDTGVEAVADRPQDRFTRAQSSRYDRRSKPEEQARAFVGSHSNARTQVPQHGQTTCAWPPAPSSDHSTPFTIFRHSHAGTQPRTIPLDHGWQAGW